MQKQGRARNKNRPQGNRKFGPNVGLILNLSYSQTRTTAQAANIFTSQGEDYQPATLASPPLCQTRGLFLG